VRQRAGRRIRATCIDHATRPLATGPND
jgi:hypothetical protein